MTKDAIRRVQGKTLVIASHNTGKLQEIEIFLQGHTLALRSAADLGLSEVEETGTTYEKNALLKAQAAAQQSGLPALADDSGLSVDALDGAPGIYSARWAGPARDFDVAMQRIENELQARGANSPDRRGARFVCVLCLAWPDGVHAFFEGAVTGVLVWPPRGKEGFGYDPVFLPKGETRTFGEMDFDEKHGIGAAHNRLSHRAAAFAKFAEAAL